MLAVTGGEPFLAARGPPHQLQRAERQQREGNSLKTRQRCEQSKNHVLLHPKGFHCIDAGRLKEMAGTTRLELATSAVTVQRFDVIA